MTPQKSENRVVPKGQRKLVPTEHESARGGKAVPVVKATNAQHELFATAASPRQRGAQPLRAEERSAARTGWEPKAKSDALQPTSATLNGVVERLDEALDKIAANRGAPGPDRRSIQDVQANWKEIRAGLVRALTEGKYRPGDIRRVWIPKPGGGERGLGIPNVVDRVVQEATRAVLEPIFEPTFHRSSHGFRPNRSCHTAITEAMGYVEEGCTWVVDIDLEKFFDHVHHQRLLARLAARVDDRRLLSLIGKMLRAKVAMPDGVRVATAEGVPQGGPLSPLLSNIVLTELDEEIGRRGLRFVRYADDCNIYVRSKRAGERVMASLTRFIEKRLRLSVNADKSAVASPETRHFLGFSLRPQAAGPPEVLLSERSHKRLNEKIVELTRRSRGQSLKATIASINTYVRGWHGFFRICTPGVERVLQNADAHIRRRLRAIVLKHWRRKRTIVRRLIQLGVRRQTAWRRIYSGRRSLWSLSQDPAVHRALRNAYFANLGLVSLLELACTRWASNVAPGKQLLLPGMS